MHLFDSLKTYGVAFAAYMVAGMKSCMAGVEIVTKILVLVAVIVRLISDLPRAARVIRTKLNWRN